ncbi:hypothetical protein EI555_004517 [Monodon monoceros]|uniref:CHHC U11-48K-type domain-containing protein n=2 Tax=Odontoceti TaxID=9722 RepID=A0A4V6WPC9_MONMO|nr:hypothetical protein EI555_004517 [Monodon monoceros]
MLKFYKGLLSFTLTLFFSLSVDTLDPEKLLQCPYDKNHQIRACRFPYHLIKCRKNHPDIANKLATCPFNARHQVPRAEISHHISSCDDKSCIEQDVVRISIVLQSAKPGTLDKRLWLRAHGSALLAMKTGIKAGYLISYYLLRSTTNYVLLPLADLWEQTSTPFVWGEANYCGNNSPASNIVMEHKSNLASGMRVPKSLPYVLPWKNSK